MTNLIFVLSKLIGALTSPLVMPVLLIVVGMGLLMRGKKKWGGTIGLLGVVVLWTLGTPVVSDALLLPLERAYPPVAIEELPQADLVHVLGGGMAPPTNCCAYADMGPSADRVWHGARIMKAGKTPRMLITSPLSGASTLPLLADLGVDTSKVIVAEAPRTTEEEARLVSGIVGMGVGVGSGSGIKPKVLVVTSATHMRRAMMLYARYAPNVEAIPAATDYGVLQWKDMPRKIYGFIPSPDALSASGNALHEYLGYYGRKVLSMVVE